VTEAEKIREALLDMVNQFAYSSPSKEKSTGDPFKDAAKDSLSTGGLSALEYAFDVLGLDDPCTRQQLWDLNHLPDRGSG
jgi:hypothetical protein